MALTRQERLDIVIKAIETQPYTVYSTDPFKEPDPRLGEDVDKKDEDGFTDYESLKAFVDNTWRGADREELFKRVANRILDALDASYLNEDK